jgi:Carboxypeptidase regulatory-like domain
VSPRRLLFLTAAIVAAALSRPAALHAQTDVIRGRVTGPDSTPVERATITVTSIAGNITRTTRTDKNGRYTVAFPGDEGDYMVSVAALGFTAKRFEIKRTGDQDILVADARLSSSAAQLDAVKVQASRQKPGRDANSSDIGGSERSVNTGNVSADALGDLAALAASMPGVQLIPGADGTSSGFSVLGLGADQNATTLNGMNFGGSNIPRDANVSSSLALAPYDVSRGNFSGGVLNIRTGRASNYIIRSTSANIDAPAAQWTDRAGQALHQQYANVSLGGLFAGPIQPDKSFFNLAYQLGRRQSDLQSLVTTDAVGLQAAGISSDSANRLVSILNRLHVPSTVGAVPNNRYSDQALVLGSMDFTPPRSTSGQAFNVTFSGSWNRSSAVTLSPTELPAHSGDRSSWNAGLQGRHTNYFGFGILSETSLGLSGNSNYGTPYLDEPSGSVRVNSSFADEIPSVQTVSFGGNPILNTSVNQVSAQLMNALSWFSENNKHRIKFTSEVRRDSYGQDLTTNRFGSFSYNSLADLDAGIPSSFTRQLSPRKRSESEYVGAFSLGDSYRPNSDLQIQYGVRVDGNRFNSEPVLNPATEQLFGIANDHVPNRVYASPRVGFSWMYGQASEIPGFIGAFRGPRAVVRGGVGVFQSTPNVAAIGSAMDNTGLANGVQQLACVGAAAPSPDWAGYMNSTSAVPSQCADGSTGTVFSSTAPNVTLFDKGYSAPRALRSNLNWSGNTFGNRFAMSADVTYSLNLNQASSVDLNFKPEQQFALASEGNRPVYAQASGIVPTTGAIAAGEGRMQSDYTHVSELRSDLKSESKQFTVSVSPTSFNSTFTWGLSYVYAQTREQYRGFTSTSGNPLDVAWGRSGFDSRHQFQYRLTYNAFDWVRVGWFGSFRTGTPYTPTVIGDINGDGYSNDRAYIFNPAATADTALANGMRSLLASGSGSARDCLESQLGQIASRNSCQGPWTTTANLTFSFNPIKVRMPQRATLQFQLSNPLGAADMLLHGENGMHGWGQNAIPSNQLLYVRGFDPASQRYRYEVNQRFGATAVGQTIARTPVTLTTMLRFDVGPTRERQALTQMLDRGRKLDGTKAPEALLKAFGPIGITNPMAAILRQADTLELTSEQADSIAVLNRAFTIKLDSAWSPVAKYLAALPKDYDQGDAYGRYREAREVSVDALMKVAPAVRSLLTAEQMRRLPTYITPFLDHRYLASVRSGSAGTGLGMIMLPGGGGMAMPMVGGGGGGAQIIIRTTGTP